MKNNADKVNYGWADRPDNIRRCRKAYGHTQVQFAKLLGVRQATVADWENGRVKPSRLAQLALINFGMNGPR